MVLLSLNAALAKDKPRIAVEVVETQTTERQVTYTVPGSASHSITNCNGNATAINLGGSMATASGNSNCTTTTTPGRPPRNVVSSIEQTHVRVIMPDGRHATLWCQGGFRSCHTLEAGHYDAQVDGNTVWMYTYDLGGKEHKTKYRYEGGW